MLTKVINLFRGSSRRATPPDQPQPAQRPAPHRPRPGSGVASSTPGRAHDYDGGVTIAYAPQHDGEPDPGEVVWTWVPYEEDAHIGKDRPVVVMGRPTGDTAGAADELAVLMLSSKDHDGDAHWLVVGAGAWDPDGRVSSVRLDRVLAVSSAAVRREGSALDRDRFDQIAAALLADHGWQAPPGQRPV